MIQTRSHSFIISSLLGIGLLGIALLYSCPALAEPNSNNIELETLKIKGNKELPKILFVVPWQDIEQQKARKNEQHIVLHSLYGDIFDPVSPSFYVKELR